MRIALSALALLLCAPAAMATTYRYASSNNRIYAEGGGTTTLSAIRASTPSLPAGALVQSGTTWTLNAQLWLTGGTVLELHGAAIGGDVDLLKLKSNAGADFIYVSAEYGTIDIDSTTIKSWDAAAAAPDTNYADGRAFIRVRSYLESDGVTARESRMDIKNSDVGYLGYNGAEAYGLVWKVIGDPGSDFSLYDKADVFGDILNSHLHHNYYGMYSFGLLGGQWVGNEVDHNAGYGFDPHDDSDDLLIEGNDVHDNGYHGIIASKRCDHVVIRNNKSYNNKEAGIMLHRSSDDGVIEGNDVHDNADSGIALFAVWRTSVRNNTATNNARSGIRLSMGAGDNVIDANTIVGGGDGFEAYKGSDVPEPGDDARPKRNMLSNNTLSSLGGRGISFSDSDSNTFQSNAFAGMATPLLTFERSTKSKLNKNTYPAGVTLDLQGDSTQGSDADVYNVATLNLTQDQYSTARFRDNSRKIFDASQAVATTASPTSSLLTLTKAITGGATTVTTRALTATPASGTVKVDPTTWNTGGDRSKAWTVKASSGSASVAYTVGNLAASTSYDVRRGSTLVGTYAASSSGSIAFSDSPGTTSTVTYSVTPH